MGDVCGLLTRDKVSLDAPLNLFYFLTMHAEHIQMWATGLLLFVVEYASHSRVGALKLRKMCMRKCVGDEWTLLIGINQDFLALNLNEYAKPCEGIVSKRGLEYQALRVCMRVCTVHYHHCVSPCHRPCTRNDY